MNDIPRIHQEYFKNAAGNNNQQKPSKDIGLTLTVFLGEKKEREKYCLNDSQENENGKEVDAIWQCDLRIRFRVSYVNLGRQVYGFGW